MRRRTGFTLVELLVAIALVVFVMVILTEAFTASMTSFRRLKGLGDMDAQLRTARNILRADLQTANVEGKGSDATFGARRISDPAFWTDGPPTKGFFHIWNGSDYSASGNPSVLEGTDGDRIPSRRATDHRLHFTMRRKGTGRGDFFAGWVDPSSPLLAPDTANSASYRPAINNSYLSVPLGFDALYQDPTNGVFSSQWAEVAYFLQQDTTAPLAGGTTQLYRLYRRQVLVLENKTSANAAGITNYNNHRNISCNDTGTNLIFNEPSDLTQQTTPPVRLTYTPLSDGSDLLLSDVLSFEVKVLVPPGTTVTADATNDPLATASTTGTFVGLHRIVPLVNPPPPGQTWRMFDTWNTASAATAPMQVPIRALEITIRIWDFKTEQARQVTIIQDL